ncbi:hypothetical protein LSM04_007716 [Trypanosoma melophagium]|uniref:uncharacterized protein n=1 Tax=Trypanosoma melophagium TaxID=715481 RepID=UPI00351A7A57|nr:hypothetical protein LSM04_007716 [Trypanosoma melophagium]
MVITSECHASAVIGVPPYLVSRLFKDITGIKEYGRDGLISCCLLENSSAPTGVGALRRITLALPDYDGAILRESLADVRDLTGRCCVDMEYVPCSREDAYRTPFGVNGTNQLVRATMHIRVSAVTAHPKRCFLEITTSFAVNVAEEYTVGGLESPVKCRDPVYNRIAEFWDRYTHRIVSAVEQYVLSLAPVVHTHKRMEMEEAQEYTEVENTYCEWAALGHSSNNKNKSNNINSDNNNYNSAVPTLPRAEVLQTMEKALNAWMRLWRELRHQRRINAQLQEDADGSKAIAATAAANAAEVAAAAATTTTTTATATGVGGVGGISTTSTATATAVDGIDQGSFRTASDVSSYPSVAPNPYRRLTAAAPGQSTQLNGEKNTVPEETRGHIASSKETGIHKLERVPFFSSGGGRCLSASTGENRKTMELQKEETQQQQLQLQQGEEQKTDVVIPYRATPAEFHRDLLQNFLTEFGTINEKNARELFNVLDKNQEGFIKEKGISFVLSQIDPLGLYEDRDGTLLQMAECRCAVGLGVFKDKKMGQRSYKKEDFLPPITSTTNTTVTATKEKDKFLLKQENADGKDSDAAAVQITPLQALIRRHDAQKKAMYDELMKKRTEKLLDSFAYRTRGKLYYDEFCLMMLHLLKEY